MPTTPFPAAEVTLPSVGIMAGATGSLRSAWDRVVEEAKRERFVQQTSTPANAQANETTEASAPATKNSAECSQGPDSRRTRRNWDRAVQQTVVERVNAFGSPTPRSPRDPALAAYETGVERMRKSDKNEAVVSFARAVELEPSNKRYRLALRRCLDWMDAPEG